MFSIYIKKINIYLITKDNLPLVTFLHLIKKDAKKLRLCAKSFLKYYS